jgi:glycosyltransferase involved in cell wall biosynthesis
MISIHQFHYRASAGEAVTQHMLFIREALAEAGIGGKIFSVQRKNLPQGKVQAWSLDSAWDCDLLLIHHSQYNPELKKLLSIEVPKAVIYHSQPPASFFFHDPDAKNNFEKGRNQLAVIKRKGLAALGVSEFAVSELVGMGFKNTGVIPLMHLESQPVLTGSLEKNEPKHLLFVGKLAPHKKQSLLIETFYHLRKELPPHSQLHLVGTGDPLYTKYLRLLIKQLGLSQSVILTGKLTDSNLSEYYTLADAFICMSEYEGFCIPVVEAMRAQVPVFYRSLTGIKETMGGAGVELLTNDPIQNALILKQFLNSPNALKAVLAKQQMRLKSLSSFQNRKTIQEQILKLCNRKPVLNISAAINKNSYDASLTF